MRILLLLAVVSFCSAEKGNINSMVDAYTKETGFWLRSFANTTKTLPPLNITDHVRYSDGMWMGLDSFSRDGDCSVETEGNRSTYDIHYQQRMMIFAFNDLEVDGFKTSAFFKVRNNSLHLSYSRTGELGKCFVTLHDFKVERLTDVEAGFAMRQLNGLNVNPFFEDIVLPLLNKHIEATKDKFAASLQDAQCGHATYRSAPTKAILDYFGF